MEIKAEKITPYGSNDPKSRQVEAMFDNIAPAYDFMNRAMTFGVDRSWRRKVVRAIAADSPAALLDVATGTGDMALQLARAIPGCRITGVDLSEGMLSVGRRKIQEAGLANRITLTKGDCLALPFPDDTFDAVTVAFGVRNFEHLDRGYAEMARVLRPLDNSGCGAPGVKGCQRLFLSAGLNRRDAPGGQDALPDDGSRTRGAGPETSDVRRLHNLHRRQARASIIIP